MKRPKFAAPPSPPHPQTLVQKKLSYISGLFLILYEYGRLAGHRHRTVPRQREREKEKLYEFQGALIL